MANQNMGVVAFAIASSTASALFRSRHQARTFCNLAQDHKKKLQAFSTTSEEKSGSIQRRASIDIGSGATKLLVADVDTAKNQIVNVLFGEERTVSFSLSAKMRDGRLSDAVMEEGLRVLKDYMCIVKKLIPPDSLIYVSVKPIAPVDYPYDFKM